MAAGAQARARLVRQAFEVACDRYLLRGERSIALQIARDAKNPDPRLREQLLIGLSLLREFRYVANGEWTGGQIYNPENGRTYHAFLKLRSPDVLEVKGCILFVCDT